MVFEILIPVTIIIELIVFLGGCYAGAVLKKQYGFFFGLSFLLFAFYDILGILDCSEEVLAAANMIASSLALAGMYVALKSPEN
ncbi:MAG: hypothetical protein PHP13_03495 [Methanomicrobium sp.]|nr:hypothetical protein [Methanomicrobium sp.]MDD4299301.1 hypothetical protein [Methanomicrobium sp.]